MMGRTCDLTLQKTDSIRKHLIISQAYVLLGTIYVEDHVLVYLHCKPQQTALSSRSAICSLEGFSASMSLITAHCVLSKRLVISLSRESMTGRYTHAV